jgi:hypothetical protein
VKFWRSYDGIVTLAWVCVVVAVALFREASLSDDALMVRLAYGVIVAAVALAAFVVYLQRKTKRQAENKVRMSDLILLTDIQILAKSNSQLLDDAITLRYAQMEQGRSPGD